MLHASRIIQKWVTLKLHTSLLLLFLSSAAWADTNLIDRIQQTERSIVTVRTELTRLMHTTPPQTATYLPHGCRDRHRPFRYNCNQHAYDHPCPFYLCHPAGRHQTAGTSCFSPPENMTLVSCASILPHPLYSVTMGGFFA